MPVRVTSAIAERKGARRALGAAPRLDVPWQKRRSRLVESLRALLTGSAPKEFVGGTNFRDCWVKGQMPRRSVAASAAWHITALVLLIQFGSFLWSRPRTVDLPNFELTWSGPIEDLPLISPGVTHKKLSPPGDPAKEFPKRGANAFHPRQTLISVPKVPNHPRQTLIRPDAPPAPPKFLPDLPNIVQLSGMPSRPQMKIAANNMIAKQPRQTSRQLQSSAVPDMPNQETNFTGLNIASAALPSKPALTISSGAATVAAPKQRTAVAAQDDTPPVIGGGGDKAETIIALSATPGPVAPPVPVPAGNLSANVSISPDGPRPGVPGGSDKGAASSGSAGGGSASAGGTDGGNGNGSATVVPGVSVSGGNPSGKTGLSGLGGSSGLRLNPRAGSGMPGMGAAPDSGKPSGKASDVPIANRLQPGAPPEHIFGNRTFYSLNVNMPNISSVSGSWILKFAELDDPGDPAAARARAQTLSGPVPLRTVDPRYPQDQIRAHIQGEVVLYALIREDGSVDSIQLITSLDPALDKCAMDALAEWKFTPATRKGVPVPLEAVVHVPFHFVRPNY